MAFDLINEPDAFGIDGISDWYPDAWVPAFRKIRQLRPQAQIVGPGFFSANLSHLRGFLSKAKADNVVPDIVSQHLLDNQSRDVVESYTAQIRAMLSHSAWPTGPSASTNTSTPAMWLRRGRGGRAGAG